MNLNIFKDYSTLSRATADLIIDYVNRKPVSLVCLASGHSPKGVFEYLIEDVQAKNVNFDQCKFVSLDEWVGIPALQYGSCRAMMNDDFFGPVKVGESQIVFFDGMDPDPNAQTDRMNQLIDEHGGLDIMLVGVGTNGHIAMNEPGTSFDQRAHVSTLTEETKSVGQKYFAESTVLNRGITLGLKHFSEAKLPILIANGARKATIIKKILESTPAESLPASIVHLIGSVYVMLDEASYGKAEHSA